MPDFEKNPELTNGQMNLYYFESPHKQIVEGFIARVEKVTDGDTIRVSTNFRDFEFPIRFAYINSPELSEGGSESKSWLEGRIMGEEVYIKINPNNRVGKFGRLIGEVFHRGMSVNQESLNLGFSKRFGENTLDFKLGDFK